MGPLSKQDATLSSCLHMSRHGDYSTFQVEVLFDFFLKFDIK